VLETHPRVAMTVDVRRLIDLGCHQALMAMSRMIVAHDEKNIGPGLRVGVTRQNPTKPRPRRRPVQTGAESEGRSSSSSRTTCRCISISGKEKVNRQEHDSHGFVVAKAPSMAEQPLSSHSVQGRSFESGCLRIKAAA